MTEKATVWMLIGLAAVVIAMKTVAIEDFIMKVVDVDWNDMYRKIASIIQGTIVSKVAVVGSKTGCLEILMSRVEWYWIQDYQRNKNERCW